MAARKQAPEEQEPDGFIPVVLEGKSVTIPIFGDASGDPLQPATVGPPAPLLGSVVVYESEHRKGPRAAIVVAVEPGGVNLTVFPPGGGYEHRANVQFGDTPGTWRWPWG